MTTSAAGAAPARFAADAMLGDLARWLRVLGFDISYDTSLADPELVRRAADEGRVLLTRDRHLLRELRPAAAVEVRKDAPLEQLQDLVAALDLPAPSELFTRCLLCNAELLPVREAEALELLPADFRDIPAPVRRCPACGKLYWQGSHARRMRLALEGALPGWLA